MIYDVVLISQWYVTSNIQQSESVKHIHAYTLFWILSPYGPLQSIEQSSLRYAEGLYYLFYVQ